MNSTNSNHSPLITQGYFSSLTGVRAAAAFLVYLIHYSPLEFTTAPIFVKEIFYQFFTGVTIFFVLSGFLITYRYYGKVQLLSMQWWRTYMVNRVARIYPIYFLLTTITFIITWKSLQPLNNALGIYLTNITFLRGFSSVLKFTLLGQGWSLTVEETFYLVAPVLLFCLSRYRLVTYPVAALLLLLLGAIAVETIHGNPMGFFSDYMFIYGWTFFGRFFEFFAGSFLAWLMLKNKLPTFRGISLTYSAMGGFLLAIIGLTCIRYTQLPLNTQYHLNALDTAAGVAVNNLVMPGIICLFFQGIITENTAISRALSSKTADLLGKSSYVFYLIGGGIIRDTITPYFDTTRPFGYLAVLVILIVISILLYRYVEEPLNRLIRRRLSGQGRTHTIPALVA
jgi:peptidoglycan/LPS O-acetylase OafA/YrhL